MLVGSWFFSFVPTLDCPVGLFNKWLFLASLSETRFWSHLAPWNSILIPLCPLKLKNRHFTPWNAWVDCGALMTMSPIDQLRMHMATSPSSHNHFLECILTLLLCWFLSGGVLKDISDHCFGFEIVDAKVSCTFGLFSWFNLISLCILL